MRGFGDFKRIAVVVIPEDEEFKQRYDKKIEIEGKEVPDTAVNEMKGSFFYLCCFFMFIFFNSERKIFLIFFILFIFIPLSPYNLSLLLFLI